MKQIHLFFLFFSCFFQVTVSGQRNITISLEPFDCSDPNGFKDFYESVRLSSKAHILPAKNLVVLQYHRIKSFPGETFLLAEHERLGNQPLMTVGKTYFDLLLVKEKGTSKMKVIPDLNFNGSFTDDSTLGLDPVNNTTRMFDWPVDRVDRKGIVHHEFKHIQISVNFVYPEDRKPVPSLLVNALAKSWRGKFDFEGESYSVAVSGIKKGFGERIAFAFEEKSSALSNKDYLYSERDTVYTNKHVFIINDLDTATQRVSISFLGENRERTGVLPGFVIRNTTFIDVRTSREVLLFSGNKPYTLLDCWGTWCGPCKEIMPELKRMARKFSDRLEIVGLALDDSIQPVSKYLRVNSIRWNNMFIPVKNAGGPRLVNQLKIVAYPTFILTNQDGLILFRTISAEGLKEIESFLEKLSI